MSEPVRRPRRSDRYRAAAQPEPDPTPAQAPAPVYHKQTEPAPPPVMDRPAFAPQQKRTAPRKKKPAVPAWLVVLLIISMVAVAGQAIARYTMRGWLDQQELVRRRAHERVVAAYPVLYGDLIETYAGLNNLRPEFVQAIILNESSYDPNAVSSVGARGLMQLTEETFHWINRRFDDRYTFDDLYDPETAIRFGCCTLAVLFDEFDATRTVIAAYHAGIGEVGEWLDDPNVSSNGRDLDAIPIDQTAHYVYKVTEAYEKYREML